MADFGGEVRTVARELSGAHAEPRASALGHAGRGFNPTGGGMVTVLTDSGLWGLCGSRGALALRNGSRGPMTGAQTTEDSPPAGPVGTPAHGPHARSAPDRQTGGQTGGRR